MKRENQTTLWQRAKHVCRQYADRIKTAVMIGLALLVGDLATVQYFPAFPFRPLLLVVVFIASLGGAIWWLKKVLPQVAWPKSASSSAAITVSQLVFSFGILLVLYFNLTSTYRGVLAYGHAEWWATSLVVFVLVSTLACLLVVWHVPTTAEKRLWGTVILLLVAVLQLGPAFYIATRVVGDKAQKMELQSYIATTLNPVVQEEQLHVQPVQTTLGVMQDTCVLWQSIMADAEKGGILTSKKHADIGVQDLQPGAQRIQKACADVKVQYAGLVQNFVQSFNRLRGKLGAQTVTFRQGETAVLSFQSGTFLAMSQGFADLERTVQPVLASPDVFFKTLKYRNLSETSRANLKMYEDRFVALQQQLKTAVAELRQQKPFAPLPSFYKGTALWAHAGEFPGALISALGLSWLPIVLVLFLWYAIVGKVVAQAAPPLPQEASIKTTVYGDSTPKTGEKVPAMARPTYSAPEGVPAGSSPRAKGSYPAPASRPPSVLREGMNPTDRLNPNDPLH